MTRFILTLALLAAFASPAFAADNGGFGASFTNKVPSALAETPNSTIAQTSQVPAAIGPDGKALQDIMPAAGDEEDTAPADPEQLAPSADGTPSEPLPVTTTDDQQ